MFFFIFLKWSTFYKYQNVFLIWGWQWYLSNRMGRLKYYLACETTHCRMAPWGRQNIKNTGVLAAGLCLGKLKWNSPKNLILPQEPALEQWWQWESGVGSRCGENSTKTGDGTDTQQRLVDRPTQLICISDIFLCQQTNTKDIAGQSAKQRYTIQLLECTILAPCDQNSRSLLLLLYFSNMVNCVSPKTVFLKYL